MPLISKEKEDQSNEIKKSIITVDLTQTKPKRKINKVAKNLQKSDSIEELQQTIERIFANEDAILITTQAELIEFLRQQEVFGLDTETTGLKFYKDKIAGFSVGTATRSAYIPLQHEIGTNYQDDIDTMCEILLERKYYGFNAKFDWHFLESFRPQLKNLQLAGEGSIALRCYNIELPHELKEIYRAVIDPSYEEYSFKKLFKSKKFTEFDPKIVYKYAAVDARKHYIIAEYFENKMREELPDVYYRYRNLELKDLLPAYNAEKYGFCIDREQVEKLYISLEEQKVSALQDVQNIAGSSEFNPSSPKQIVEVFKGLGITLTSTGEEVLGKLDHPLAKGIIKYREIVKLQGTYTTNLYEFCDCQDANLIIHTDFNTIGADTTRMSSKDPNLQNIPKNNDYRAIFIARPGHTLCSVDYAQQEVRILAALAKDQTMIDAFKSGKDFYAFMASIVFNLPYEQCTKGSANTDKRNQMKSVVLGLNYSMGMKALAVELGVSEMEATQITEDFYRACPKVRGFQEWALCFAKEHGYNETLFKHRRYYKGLGYAARGLSRFEIFGPGLKNGDVTKEEVLLTLQSFSNSYWKLRDFIKELEAPAKKKETKHLAIYVKDRESIAFSEERQCTNSVVQGTGAEMTKLASIVVDKDPEMIALCAHIVNFVHDELIIEAPDANIKRAGERLAEIMNDVCLDMLDGLPGGAEPEYMKKWKKG